MEEQSSLIRFSHDAGIARITIDRPEKLNALDAEMIAELHRLCAKINSSDAIRVVLMSGSGDRAFSAGGDIDAWGALSPRQFMNDWLRTGHDAFNALARLRCPVIAALNGDVFGGGLELAATADLRIAEDHIRIGQPESGLGVIPGWSGTQRAVRRFGAQNVRRMALFGENYNAQQALQAGIVDHVAPRGEAMNAATSMAERILKRGPQATTAVKMLINAAEGEERETALEVLAGWAVTGSGETKKGIEAFRDKRKPDFGSDE